MKHATMTISAAAIAFPMLVHGTAKESPACGYHGELVMSQVGLSWTYPDALHVTGAVWAGQQAGVLAMPDPVRLQATGAERVRLDAKAFDKSTQALHTLGGALGDAAGRPDADLALVLIETMLWTRYVRAEDRIEVRSHINAPEEGDLVVITEEPVLHAIVEGRLPVAEAITSGFVRIYGTPEQECAFRMAFGAVGEEPLPEVELPPPSIGTPGWRGRG